MLIFNFTPVVFMFVGAGVGYLSGRIHAWAKRYGREDQ